MIKVIKNDNNLSVWGTPGVLPSFNLQDHYLSSLPCSAPQLHSICHISCLVHLSVWSSATCLVFSRYVRCSHHGAEPAHRNPHCVWAGRKPEAREAHVFPGRRGNRKEGHGGRGCPGQSQEVSLRWRLCEEAEKKRLSCVLSSCLLVLPCSPFQLGKFLMALLEMGHFQHISLLFALNDTEMWNQADSQARIFCSQLNTRTSF